MCPGSCRTHHSLTKKKRNRIKKKVISPKNICKTNLEDVVFLDKNAPESVKINFPKI